MEDATNNPYTPPNSELEKTENSITNPVPATKTKRFLNYLVDMVAYIVLGGIVGVIMGVVGGEAAVVWLESTPDFFIGLPILVGYYLVFEGVWGVTIGKLVTGTRVVNEQGLKPSFGQILGRTVTRIVPFEGLTFLGKTGRGWHDSWANTYVVNAK